VIPWSVSTWTYMNWPTCSGSTLVIFMVLLLHAFFLLLARIGLLGEPQGRGAGRGGCPGTHFDA
jgi:hypothetical protein